MPVRPAPASDHYLRPGPVTDVEATARGVRARLGTELLELDVVRRDVLRVRISRAGRFEQHPTHSVCVDSLSPEAGVEVHDAGTHWTVTSAGFVATLGLDPFTLDVLRPDGTPVQRTAVDGDGGPDPYRTLNDAFAIRRRREPGDAFYGLGERSGPHNRSGRDYTLWNTDVLNPTAAGEFTAGLDADDPRADRTSTEFDPYYAGIPLLYQHAVDGSVSASFVDNAHRAHYDLTSATEWTAHFGGGQYTEYILAGPTVAGILEAFTWLTGRSALPPLWALGFQQCRWKAYDQDEVLALAAAHRAAAVPCDALWLDIDHMDGYRVFTWNRDLFPDPSAMIEQLGELGFKLVTIVDPGVKHDPGWEMYDDAVAADVLCRTDDGEHYIGQVWPGNTVFPDFATDEARAWWGRYNAEHVATGVAGIWNDMNEPATGDIPTARMRFDHGTQPHERFHNQYALLMAMGTVAGLQEAKPDRRTFVLSRAGSAGIQRYAANWMGDNQSRWDHLWLSMPMAMGFGLSGQPFVGADVGGFAGDTTGELLLRWTQYAALTPFFRNHSMAQLDQYAWSFGPAVLAGVRDAIALRYRLMPYLYSCFAEAHRLGTPVQRPLVHDFQYDAAVRDIDDEFLLGSNLLVAPVYEPGVTARQVYLPAGGWYDSHNDEFHAGRQWVIAATPADRIPTYVRAGAVLPTWTEVPPSTAGYRPSVLHLDVTVPHDDRAHLSVLQEDDGETTAADDGAFLRTTFTVIRLQNLVMVRAFVEGDGYDGFAREAFVLRVTGASPDTVTYDDEPIAGEDGVFVLPNTGTGFKLTFAVTP